jgi:demethylmenaquinone methyltransferase/2-methoxy-6-polyprenyl-1,4-benzoquinol methylase
MVAYYDRRAVEYDDWYLGRGLFADVDRPGFDAELAVVTDALATLRPARTVDVACGTGFITRHLPGEVIGLDYSPAMLAAARSRLHGPLVSADGLALPFGDDSIDRVFTGHFYGHLKARQRAEFLSESRRVAPELVVLDAALRDEVEPEESQVRVLSDGSQHVVYKRYFTSDGLLSELGGGQAIFEGRWFVLVRSV